MLRFRLVTLVAVLSVASACAATPESVPPPEPAEPGLVASLPERIGSFEYEGYKHFAEATEGFSLRYTNRRKRRMADVYVYPVVEENRGIAHEKLVLGSTHATMRAIGEAVRQGLYANFHVVGAATRARGLRTVARVQATYLRENLEYYTLVYQTEYEGTLVKIRLSMPDNASNRESREWDHFAERIFALVVDSLDATAA